jgi:hypothetical protein
METSNEQQRLKPASAVEYPGTVPWNTQVQYLWNNQVQVTVQHHAGPVLGVMSCIHVAQELGHDSNRVKR